MTDADALAILEDAQRRCGTEDMRTPEVFEALQYLERQAVALLPSLPLVTIRSEMWPFDQFRRTLGTPGTPFTLDHAGRGQVVNAALNGIRRVCRIATPRP